MAACAKTQKKGCIEDTCQHMRLAGITPRLVSYCLESHAVKTATSVWFVRKWTSQRSFRIANTAKITVIQMITRAIKPERCHFIACFSMTRRSVRG